jgi:hypothetical protein
MCIQEVNGTDEVTKKEFGSWSLLRTKLKLPPDAKFPYVVVGDLQLAIPVPITPEGTVGVTWEV